MIDWFDPAYKAGGPIRSAVNFVQHMNEDYDLFVFTGDRDLNQPVPLKGVDINRWSEYSTNAKVYYASKEQQGLGSVKKMIDSIEPEFIYLNSVFSKTFTIFPMILKVRRLTGNAKVIMSPRGMLRSSALQFKASKKKIFLAALKLSGLASKLTYIATDKEEATDIENSFGKCNIKIASNFGAAIIPYQKPISKAAGAISIIFIGRIHPIKNLHFLLKSLVKVTGKVEVTIVGVLEQPSYWEQCNEIIANFPPTISVEFKGDLPHNELSNLISNHHIFALPTQGENYGHAIFESLSHGKPVVISDQTPWRNLAEINAGWDLPLNDPTLFTNVIQTALNWNQQEYNEWSLAAWQKAAATADNSALKEQYKTIFN